MEQKKKKKNACCVHLFLPSWLLRRTLPHLPETSGNAVDQRRKDPCSPHEPDEKEGAQTQVFTDGILLGDRLLTSFHEGGALEPCSPSSFLGLMVEQGTLRR